MPKSIGMNDKIRMTYPFVLLLMAGAWLCTSCIFGENDSGESPIGKTWTKHSVGVSGLTSVAWTGENLVAVGVVGTVVSSPEGINWTHHQQSADLMMSSITWTGSRLVAVGYRHSNDSNLALISLDGLTWSIQSPGADGKKLSRVAWGGDLLVAVGESGTILTSPDGETWTERTSGTSSWLGDVVYTGSQWVAVGEEKNMASQSMALTSPDGITWSRHSVWLPYPITSVTWTGKSLVAVGGRVIATSPDGKDWTQRSDKGGSFVSWSGGILVALGFRFLQTSPDGIAWTERNTGAQGSLNSVAFTGSRLVVVGAVGTILTSP